MFHFGSYANQRNRPVFARFTFGGLFVYRDNKSRFPVIGYTAGVERASDFYVRIGAISRCISVHEPPHVISNNVVCASSIHLIRAFASRLNIL